MLTPEIVPGVCKRVSMSKGRGCLRPIAGNVGGREGVKQGVTPNEKGRDKSANQRRQNSMEGTWREAHQKPRVQTEVARKVTVGPYTPRGLEKV